MLRNIHNNNRYQFNSLFYVHHFSTVQWTGTRLRSSLEPRTRVHVTRSFRKRSDIFYGASKDPSHEWSYEHLSIVIGKVGPASYGHSVSADDD